MKPSDNRRIERMAEEAAVFVNDDHHPLLEEGSTFVMSSRKKNSDRLPQPIWNPEKIINQCYRVLMQTSDKEPTILYPVALHKSTKKNKYRFDSEDRTSPLGIIKKLNVGPLDDDVYAYAYFKVYQLIAWVSGYIEEHGENGAEEK